MITLVVADDQALVRSGLSSILSKDPAFSVVGEAADGAEAVELARSHRPDIVLMDLRMPNVDGLEATRRILQGDDPPRVVVLTTFDTDDNVYAALRAGASGFLLKDTSPEHLADALRRVMDGDAMLSPTVTRRLVDSFVSEPPRPDGSVPAALRTLSDRELEVLRVLARGTTNAEIACELYLAETTVKSHIARLLTKLGLRDRVQAVVLAHESGLMRTGQTGSRATGDARR
ncbi:response regulator [Agromyces sp. GXQ0307]|uniref:response regulator n=1 Tax=Agromyces sp. GXQ0307 TaxID=3377835 RepID=UPI00383A636B